MAALLDAIFDDKEKLVALLTSSLHHVVPYLRTRNASEHSYYVMALLASLCDYQYPFTTPKGAKSVELSKIGQ